MKYFTLFCCIYWMVCPIQSRCQVIVNGDFEVMDSCPTNLGQVSLCHNWQMVVLHGDYYNCGLFTTAYPSDHTAFTGTGYMGFATYGNAIGAAEAIGQVLSVPIMPNISGTIELAAKKTSSGTWSQNCGGVSIYGIKGPLPIDTIGIHVSQLPNVFLLATTSMIQDSIWSTYTLNFTTQDTVDAIVFTNEHTPNCAECVFIDAVSVQLNPSGTSEFENPVIHVYPNPSQGKITIETNQIGSIKSVQITDVLGKSSMDLVLTTFDNKIIIENVPGGVSFVQIQFENGKLYTQRIVDLN